MTDFYTFPVVPVAELDQKALFRERQALLDLKFCGKNGAFERRHEVRLTWVRWQLDRIEMSKHSYRASVIPLK